METSKQWRAREYGDDELTADDRVFFATHTGVTAHLVPQVFSHFRRVTLLGLDANERVTIDLDLGIEKDGMRRPIDGVAIVEVKQWPRRRDSLAMTTLRAAGIRPGSASKYCTSIALTHPELHANTLLPALRALTGSAA